jgi:hypothetical protein
MRTFIMCLSAFSIIASVLCMIRGHANVAIWWAIMGGFWLAISSKGEDV